MTPPAWRGSCFYSTQRFEIRAVVVATFGRVPDTSHSQSRSMNERGPDVCRGRVNALLGPILCVRLAVDSHPAVTNVAARHLHLLGPLPHLGESVGRRK